MALRPKTAAGNEDRAAVVDIGSNTIHLLVADCRRDCFRSVYDDSVRAGLGVATAEGAPLGPDRIHTVTSIVRAFDVEARVRGAREVIVVGTHAVRVAPDRTALIEAIEREAKLTLRVLSTDEEARFCVAGIALGPLPPSPFLCADIGGGSCDLAAVGSAGVEGTASVPVGSGILAARELADDPPAAHQIERTAARLLSVLVAVDSLGRPAFSDIAVTGGAARRLLRQTGAEYGAPLPVCILHELVERLSSNPSAAWPRPVRPERAALVRAGGIILRAIVTRWQVATWRVSAFGLREGVLACWARGWSFSAEPGQRGGEEINGRQHA
jgi:exopolyphosphatase/guanosine-5'-triphosphate,3'-diphosphate pyrophosphatase